MTRSMQRPTRSIQSSRCRALAVEIGLAAALALLVPRVTLAATPPTVYVARSGTADYVCDGTSDDLDIQKALNFVAANTGKGFTTVYLKAGTYSIADTMVLPSNIVVTGDKAAVLRLKNNVGWSANSQSFFAGTGVQNLKMHGFELDGNRDNQGGLPHGKGYHNLIVLKSSKNIEIYNMHWHHSLGDGAQIRNSSDISFHDNAVEYLGHDVVYLLYSKNAKVYRNKVVTVSNSACRTTQSDQVEIYENDYQGTTKYSSTGPLIEIQFGDSDGLSGINIHDNYFHDCNGAGIWAFEDDKSKGSKIQVHHNVFNNTGNYKSDSGYSSSGILLEGLNASIQHNVFFNCQKSGIRTTLSSLHSSYSLGSYTVEVTNNVFMNMRAYSNGTGAALWNERSNYAVKASNNCFYKNAGGNTQGSGITVVSALSDDPLFANTGSGDFHLKSKYGRWSGSGWVFDAVTSPCIDAGLPSSPYALEPMPNGARANIGRYGNTAQASRSPGVVPPADAAVVPPGDAAVAPPADGAAPGPDGATPAPDLGDASASGDQRLDGLPQGDGGAAEDGSPADARAVTEGCGACALGSQVSHPSLLLALWIVPLIVMRRRRSSGRASEGRSASAPPGHRSR